MTEKRNPGHRHLPSQSVAIDFFQPNPSGAVAHKICSSPPPPPSTTTTTACADVGRDRRRNYCRLLTCTTETIQISGHRRRQRRRLTRSLESQRERERERAGAHGLSSTAPEETCGSVRPARFFFSSKCHSFRDTSASSRHFHRRRNGHTTSRRSIVERRPTGTLVPPTPTHI